MQPVESTAGVASRGRKVHVVPFALHVVRPFESELDRSAVYPAGLDSLKFNLSSWTAYDTSAAFPRHLRCGSLCNSLPCWCRAVPSLRQFHFVSGVDIGKHSVVVDSESQLFGCSDIKSMRILTICPSGIIPFVVPFSVEGPKLLGVLSLVLAWVDSLRPGV